MSNKTSLWIKIKTSVFYFITIVAAFFVVMYVFFREALLRDWGNPWECNLTKDEEKTKNK